MGVDFYTCQNEKCGYNFPDCGEYFRCGCERIFCSEECAGGRQIPENDPHYGDGGENSTCMYCRGEVVSDADLLAYLLKRDLLTRETLAQECAEAKAREKFRATALCAPWSCRHRMDLHGAEGCTVGGCGCRGFIPGRL